MVSRDSKDAGTDFPLKSELKTCRESEPEPGPHTVINRDSAEFAKSV